MIRPQVCGNIQPYAAQAGGNYGGRAENTGIENLSISRRYSIYSSAGIPPSSGLASSRLTIILVSRFRFSCCSICGSSRPCAADMAGTRGNARLSTGYRAADISPATAGGALFCDAVSIHLAGGFPALLWYRGPSFILRLLQCRSGPEFTTMPSNVS